jgi:hypothetical protein
MRALERWSVLSFDERLEIAQFEASRKQAQQHSRTTAAVELADRADFIGEWPRSDSHFRAFFQNG